MALPTSRNTTYAALSQVKSVDLNAIQDAIVEHKRPSVPRSMSPYGGMVTAGTWTFSANHITSGGAGAEFRASLFLEAGDRITAFQFAAFGDGAADATYQVNLATADMATNTTHVAPTNDDNRAAAWGVVAPAFTPYTAPAGGAVLTFVISANAAGYSVGTISWTIDRL